MHVCWCRVQIKIWFQNRRTKWKKQNPGSDINSPTPVQAAPSSAAAGLLAAASFFRPGRADVGPSLGAPLYLYGGPRDTVPAHPGYAPPASCTVGLKGFGSGLDSYPRYRPFMPPIFWQKLTPHIANMSDRETVRATTPADQQNSRALCFVYKRFSGVALNPPKNNLWWLYIILQHCLQGTTINLYLIIYHNWSLYISTHYEDTREAIQNSG